MHKKLIVLSAFLFYTAISFAQLSEVGGSIKDTTANLLVKNAVVALLSPKDSVLRSFARTKDDGSYTLKVPAGKYILMVMHPYFADYVDDIEIKNSTEKMGMIPVTSKSKLLQAVILKSGSAIKIKGDTTIYTADSFKVSANANVEELLKKLPGIQVDKNGEIKAMGEKVEKVLVDGEEFFGDDPGMAVKNLRADAVKEVQVFDKKSEQAEFTGIDDGKTQKTINLKLKDDRKTGYFGKIDVSGGLLKNIDDRYNNNIMFSTFKGKRKLSAFLLNGNTGQDGLSWQDNEKYGGESDNYSMSMDEESGGIYYQWRGGGSDEEPYVNTENGYIKNVNAGLQYSNKWNDKQTVNFSPKYNSQVYDNIKQTFSIRQLPGDSSLIDTAITNTHVNRYNFKMSGSYDVKLDSNNTMKLTLKSNFYHTESEEDYLLKRTDQDSILLNSSDKNTRINNDKQSFSANVIFKHKFKKLRRTLSLTADWYKLKTDGTNYLKSVNEDYKELISLNVDQKIDIDKSTNKISSRLVYTEPLGKKYAMELGYEISYNSGSNDQLTHSYNPVTGKYDFQVDSLTNDFDQKIIINKPSLKFNYSDKKIKYNFGSGFGVTNFDLVDKTYNKEYKRNFTNIFPAASFTYTYKANHSLRVNYNGNSTQPTINQLQPLRNSTDQFDQYIGNPDLKPSFTNTVNLSHNTYNFIKDMWTYASVNIRSTSNSITNSRNYNGGKVITQPINTNGNLSASMWSGMGFKVKKIDTRFYIATNASYYKFADFIDGLKNTSKTLNVGLSLNASKTKDKKYDFSLNNEFNYNTNRNSLNTNKYSYPTNTMSLDATIYIKKVWSINSNFQNYYRGKLNDAAQPLNNNLWSAKLQRTFKSNEFTVYLKVRDILNENIGIDRTFDANSYVEERNERLKRYFLLGFAWDFKNKTAKTK